MLVHAGDVPTDITKLPWDRPRLSLSLAVGDSRLALQCSAPGGHHDGGERRGAGGLPPPRVVLRVQGSGPPAASALRRAVGHPGLKTSFRPAGPAVLVLEPGDTVGLGALIAVQRRYSGTRVGVRSAASDSVARAVVLEALRSGGADSLAVEYRAEPGPVELRVRRGGG